MKLLEPVADWFDVRPQETRSVALSFLGAFFVIGFLVLARSLREAFYLAVFDVRTLPYMTGAVALTTVPAAGLFARLLDTHDPRRVLFALTGLLSAGLLILWRLADAVQVATVAFYLWTAIGSLLLTSGFWIVTSEHFALRDAKRLFGLIGAGGTAGAMVMGNSLTWITPRVPIVTLVPGLVLVLALFIGTQMLIPGRLSGRPRTRGGSGTGVAPRDEGRWWASSLRENLRLVWKSRHLRLMALVILTATVVSGLVDYQFKDAAQATLGTPEGLVRFFGAFYAWTGALALVIQLILTARVMNRGGIAVSLAALPLLLLLGSAVFLLLPVLTTITAVRGTSYTLRKSLYRSVLEVLYVPLPAPVRRRTKTFLDTTVDAFGEGAAAAIIFLLVTWGGMPALYLSVAVIVLCAVSLYLDRGLGLQYFRTLTGRLTEDHAPAADRAVATGFDRRDLLSASFTRLDLPAVRNAADRLRGTRLRETRSPPAAEPTGGAPTPSPAPPDPVSAGGVTAGEQDPESLMRRLARDHSYRPAVDALVALGDAALPHLLATLRDPEVDFVIRRRIPAVLARVGGPETDEALLDALSADRFEVRYRAAIALVRRQKSDRFHPQADHGPRIWAAIRMETGRERPVWELQKLLDDVDRPDALVQRRVGARGELSLEHTFRLLSLVLDPDHVRSAFAGIIEGDAHMKSLALEYLEHVLPPDIRRRLWPFIGDLSHYRRQRSIRPLDNVVSELVRTGATLFGTDEDRAALRRILDRDSDAG